MRSVTLTTSDLFSTIQSLPVMPQSKAPSSTYRDISWARNKTGSISESSIDGKYVRSLGKEILNPAFLNILKVDSCRLPLGRPNFSTLFFIPLIHKDELALPIVVTIQAHTEFLDVEFILVAKDCLDIA